MAHLLSHSGHRFTEGVGQTAANSFDRRFETKPCTRVAAAVPPCHASTRAAACGDGASPARLPVPPPVTDPQSRGRLQRRRAPGQPARASFRAAARSEGCPAAGASGLPPLTPLPFPGSARRLPRQGRRQLRCCSAAVCWLRSAGASQPEARAARCSLLRSSTQSQRERSKRSVPTMPKAKRSVPTMPKANPQVSLDLSIDGYVAGRITFELFADTVPKTAENFRALCTGERGRGLQTRKLLHLKDTRIYRIVRGFVAQGGLVGESIYGGTFIDENFERKHDRRGLLSMANSGPHSNGSHFFITLNPLPNLNGKHVVFGKAVSGVELLGQLEAVSADNGTPSCEVLISDCGQVDTNTDDELLGMEGEVGTRTESRGRKRKKRRESHCSNSSDENSDAGNRKRRSSKNKHTRRKKKRPYSSESSSDDSSAGHGRKRRSSRKSSKRSKPRDSKRETGGSRRRTRRTRTFSSNDSGTSTSDDKRGCRLKN